MNPNESAALSALKASKNYADICPDTVERVFLEQLPKYKKLKDAEKSARSQLHAITGAFITNEELSRARAAFDRWREGEPGALREVLLCHASTRERVDEADALFDRVFDVCENPKVVLDLACGFNPIYLGARGSVSVTGADIHGGCVRFVNDCARACGWPVCARLGDLLSEIPTDACDLALMMKLLPVLENQKSGAAIRLLGSVRARFILVTFPTRTLGGRGIGMERHYSEWFEALRPENAEIIDRFATANELAYVLKTNNFTHSERTQPCRNYT